MHTRKQKNFINKLLENVNRLRRHIFQASLKSPTVFSKPAIEYSINKVDDLRKKGDLPYESKKIFTNDLLEIGKCICQADLESNIKNGQETNTRPSRSHQST